MGILVVSEWVVGVAFRGMGFSLTPGPPSLGTCQERVPCLLLVQTGGRMPPSPSLGTAGPCPLSPFLCLILKFRRSSDGPSWYPQRPRELGWWGCPRLQTWRPTPRGALILAQAPGGTQAVITQAARGHVKPSGSLTSCPEVCPHAGSRFWGSASIRLGNELGFSASAPSQVAPGDAFRRPPTWPGAGGGWDVVGGKEATSQQEQCAPRKLTPCLLPAPGLTPHRAG